MIGLWNCSILFLTLCRETVAHYAFSKLLVNNAVTENWKYVRNITTSYQNLIDPKYQVTSQFVPYYDVYAEDIRCGRGGTASGSGTQTATVAAGDSIGFVIGVWSGYAGREGIKTPHIYHKGPGQAYLSKAPGNLESYTGDGDWFKIGTILATNNTYWPTFNKNGMNFTIPKTTPPGKYLLRVEHIYLFHQFNRTQFYVSCAHVDIVGPGGGTPGPLVKFPGAYDIWDPSIWVPWQHADVIPEGPTGLTTYVPPGPPVWPGREQ